MVAKDVNNMQLIAIRYVIVAAGSVVLLIIKGEAKTIHTCHTKKKESRRPGPLAFEVVEEGGRVFPFQSFPLRPTASFPLWEP